MTYRPRLRSAVIGACAAALLAGSGLLALPAQAESLQSPTTASQLREERAEAETASFFQDYLDAVNGIQHDGKDTFAIRKEYLSPELNGDLDEWEGVHKVNPIFRRSEVVKSWTTAYKGLGADGKHTVDLTERWEDGAPDTIVRYTLLENLQIVGLTEAPVS
ncbi:hypothetical protein [Streptomyces xanthophaeus]|uniref:hypothetical protein n=1 Tax=Streptomyces xanthophaeus TaxID=67385 RepID=UPI0036518EE7